MKVSKAQQQKIDFLLKELSSGIEKKISDALAGLSSLGNSSVLYPIALTLRDTKSDKNRKEILHFFSSLVDPDAATGMIELIQNDDLSIIRQALLTTIWSGKIDYSSYVAEFVELSVDGDFLIALDCLTIMEQMSGPFNESHLLEAQLHLKEYLEQTSDKEQRHREIISDIAFKIKEFIQNEDDGIGEFLV